MRIRPVGNYGLQLTRFGVFNCYLVRESDGWTLIDANLEGSCAAILRTAGGRTIQRILLTHPHVDHVGAVDPLMQSLRVAVLGASERSIPLLHRPPDTSLLSGEVGVVRGGLSGILSGVSLRIAEGDCIGSLRVINTPGHIHGHLAFFDERDGTLYAGDALTTFGGLRITGWAPWWFPLKAYSNRAQARETAEKLLTYPVRRFAAGHGPVLEGGSSLLQDAIRKATLKPSDL